MYKTKEEIENWLNYYNVKYYTINDDLTVDVNGNVNLNGYTNGSSSISRIIEIPIQFNIVNGGFDCSANNLTSLKGCPIIVKHDFSCSSNKLKTLEYLPIIYGRCICNAILKDALEYKKYLMLNALRK